MQSDYLNMMKQTKEFENNNRFMEEKIRQLMRLNKDLEKNQAVYIAKRDDKIDEALGYYLNTYPEKEKLKIMFLRESEGVY